MCIEDTVAPVPLAPPQFFTRAPARRGETRQARRSAAAAGVGPDRACARACALALASVATVAPPHLYLAACAMMTSAPADALEFLRRATTLAGLQQAASCRRTTPRCYRTAHRRPPAMNANTQALRRPTEQRL
ncbi:hypothetical protein MRX96_020194 [Rhipicephalus microplus]